MKEYKTNIDKIELKRTKSDFCKTKVSQSSDAADCIRKFYLDDITIFESFFILLLNRSNNTIGFAKISQGGTAGTVIDLKIIAKYAIDSLAHAVILAHNHPSGNIDPSNTDLDITKKIIESLELFDIQVLDHIILSNENYYSFKDNGQI